MGQPLLQESNGSSKPRVPFTTKKIKFERNIQMLRSVESWGFLNRLNLCLLSGTEDLQSMKKKRKETKEGEKQKTTKDEKKKDGKGRKQRAITLWCEISRWPCISKGSKMVRCACVRKMWRIVMSTSGECPSL